MLQITNRVSRQMGLFSAIGASKGAIDDHPNTTLDPMANNKYIIGETTLEHVRNRHEARVIDTMRAILSDMKDFCGCRICLEDVFAVAMNGLPAHYVQSASIVLKKMPPTEQDISRAVADAIDVVQVRPNHPE